MLGFWWMRGSGGGVGVGGRVASHWRHVAAGTLCGTEFVLTTALLTLHTSRILKHSCWLREFLVVGFSFLLWTLGFFFRLNSKSVPGNSF